MAGRESLEHWSHVAVWLLSGCSSVQPVGGSEVRPADLRFSDTNLFS